MSGENGLLLNSKRRGLLYMLCALYDTIFLQSSCTTCQKCTSEDTGLEKSTIVACGVDVLDDRAETAQTPRVS